MNYGIVRVQKFSSGSVKGIEIHDRREKEGISHTNKDIDWSKTDFNYDLCEKQNKSFTKASKERISKLNLKKAVRKDAVVMAQVLVTSDHEFFETLPYSEVRNFFENSYAFLSERYGKENVISATVHMDERTPHMHFNFVPVTQDGRLSAKSVLNRQSLIEQQTAFYQQVGQRYGLQRGQQGGKKRHLDVAEYKVTTLHKEAQNVAQDVSRLKDSLIPLQTEYNAKQAYVNDCDRSSDISMKIPYYAKVKKTLLGNENIIVPLEKWKEKHISANEKSYLKKASKELEQGIRKFKHTSSYAYLKQLTDKIYDLQSELREEKSKNNDLLYKNNILNKQINEIFKISPELKEILKQRKRQRFNDLER